MPAESPQPQAAAVPSSWPSEAARKAAYSTVAEEEVHQLPVAVRGCLPPWLHGSFLRNGPGNYDGMDHLFDGFSLLGKFELDGATNSVTASHRFLQSVAYQHFRRTGRLKWREVGTPRPHDNLWDAVLDVAQTLLGVLGWGDGVTDNASVSLVPQPNGRCLALTETLPGTFLVDVASLATLERVRYKDGIRGDITTAHPTLLPNGDLINFLSTVRLNHWVGGGFTLYRQAAADPYTRQRLAQIPPRHAFAPAWVHDFPSSLNYTVIPEMPLYFNLWTLLTGAKNEHMFMDWKPEEGSLIHIVSHKTGQVKCFRAPPFFVFHWANAWESEDGRYLFLDGAVYDDARVVGDLYLAPVRAGYSQGQGISQSHYRRLKIDLLAPNGSEVGSDWELLVADESSYGHFCEFPAVSPTCRGRPYRFAYATCATRPTNAGNSLVKFDNQLRTCKVWHEPGSLVGEPIFVPTPGPAGQAEDAGAVLATLTQADGMTALLVLDGVTFEETARAVLPYSLPSGFHGCFVPA
ncbi:hypothetical protein N2152v2_011012 [Parachlorella kessleri]